MGSATRHRQKFLSIHTLCAFCGGQIKSTTIEHCPPRAMFQNRAWPEGFEFPSCSECNNGSDDHDLLIAMLARMDPITNKGDKDGRLNGLIKMVNKQYPNLLSQMIPTANEARKHSKALGLLPREGQSHLDLGIAKIPQELHEAIATFSRKLTKGIYYRETKAIFPNDGCLLLNWFTNADLLRDKSYSTFEALKDLNGLVPQVERSGKFLNDQFEYKLSLSAEKELIVIQALFGNSFGFVVLGSALAGRLESMITRLSTTTGKDSPFTVLQSSN